MKTFTIGLVGLEKQRSIVVGGGCVAVRKVEALLQAGANIIVIAPAFSAELATFIDHGLVGAVERPFQEGDLDGAFLAIAATDEPQTNHQVWLEARRCGCLVNVVDNPEQSNFIMPAVVRRGDLTVAISTGGASPALARRLRENLETQIGPEYGDLIEILAELRPELMTRFDPGSPRLEAALRLVDADLLEILRQSGREAAQRRALELLEDGPSL